MKKIITVPEMITGYLFSIDKPTAVASFEVRENDGGKVLWKFECTPPVILKAIAYGEVPRGCVQVQPLSRRWPRPFHDGEALVKTTITKDWEFEHHGIAMGDVGFCGGTVKSGPRQPPSHP